MSRGEQSGIVGEGCGCGDGEVGVDSEGIEAGQVGCGCAADDEN